MLDSKRILIIEDDEDYKRLLGAVLARSPEAFDVKTARSLAEGLALLKAFHPEIVLMDLDLPDSTGYETFLRVQAQAHEVPLIMLTALDDDSTAVQSVKDGAQDYLVKSHIQPKVIPRLINMALHRVKRGAERNGTGAGKPGHVIGFIGSKGGVGTSTTAVNVAAALAQSGSDTVVIELHSGAGTLSLYAKSEPAGGLKALLEKPADTITALDLEHHLVEAVRGVRLLCPGSSVIQTPIGVKHAHAIISAAKRVVPYVVLDLPARIDEGVAAALKLCDCLALVIDREPSSVHCGAAALQQIESVISPNVGFGRIVIDRTVLDTPLPLEDMQHLLNVQPVVFVPHAASAIARSHWVRTPLMLLHPDELFKLAHLELAQRLLALSARSTTLGDHREWPANGNAGRSAVLEPTRAQRR